MLNKLLSIKIENRIKLIEKVIQNPIQYQNKILRQNIDFAKNTIIGKKYNFNKITNYTHFKNNIPLFNYELLQNFITQMKIQKKNVLWPGTIKWFAKSSGTTNNKSKFIPISKESLHDNHFKAGKDMLSLYLNNYPASQFLKGKSLMIGGSQKINRFSNYYSGDLSAIIIKNLPIWVQLKRSPSMKTALLDDWEKKITYIIKEAKNKNITSISGVPSWTLIIIKKIMQDLDVKCLSDIWPNLELYMHGGVSFQNYRESFNYCINKKNINYLELYNASEGFFAIQNEYNKTDLLLLLNHGIFYEFIPLKNGEFNYNSIIPLEDVKLNQIYSMTISTNGGLWRYQIGDTVKFTSLKPYKIKIVGRTKSFINVFGEELNENNANQAIEYACRKTNAILNEYTAGPIFFDDHSGAHEWFIDFNIHPTDLNKFTHHLDSKLKMLNSDYEAKREKNILLKKPKINILQKNFFLNYLKSKNKIGGQNKIQRLHNDRKNLSEIIQKI
ncbi:MAG: hypothetical protein CMP49_06690 [Flavobacteriales bacterium]|jgi:hypothetical protein|nr:hypothetical protein [Flavobacteriales bacterium]|tara:strand:- start:10570 stop:12066 length:1497 start_codon:yes stop_codon:yes gene_type:complete